MSQLPGNKNLRIFKGGTFRKPLVLHQGATTTTPVVDLTGYTARMELRNNQGVLTDTLTTENGGIDIDGPLGMITLYMSDEDTALIAWSQLRYVLYLITPSGDSDPLLQGTISTVS